MGREVRRCFVYISCTGPARPVRVRDGDEAAQLRSLVGGETVFVSLRNGGRYILVVSERAQALPGCMNGGASFALGDRGRYVKGDAVLCMVDDHGNYLGFEKLVAQGICLWANLIG